MRVRVVRVPRIPFNVQVYIDDRPSGVIIWVLEDQVTELGARFLEAAINGDVKYWMRLTTLLWPPLHVQAS